MQKWPILPSPEKNNLKEVGLKAQIFQFFSIFTHILTSPSNKLDTSPRKKFFKIIKYRDSEPLLYKWYFISTLKLASSTKSFHFGGLNFSVRSWRPYKHLKSYMLMKCLTYK